MALIPVYRKRSKQRGDVEVVCYATVDDAFAAQASRRKWYLNKWGYALGATAVNGIKVSSLHLLVWVLSGRSRPKKPLTIDHADQDKMNCRASNLRVANKTLQAANAGRRKDNTTGYKGVFRCPNRGGMFSAICRQDGKLTFLGNFYTPEGAAREVNDFYREHHPDALPPNPTVKFMPGWVATRHHAQRRRQAAHS